MLRVSARITPYITAATAGGGAARVAWAGAESTHER